MNGNFRIGRVLGIPIVVNVSWLLTLAFVVGILALRFYPQLIPEGSPHRNDHALHWAMALASGAAFFLSILLHELAHSIIAKRQGIPVRSITLFVFGGVSQITGESRRPLNEFVMAIVGPLTSLFLALACFAAWWLTGHSDHAPVALVLQWLFLMNLVLAVFNMAPGFPMDGGRVLRSVLWGVSGNMLRATRLATLAGRALGYALMFLGFLALLGLFNFVDPWSGAWMMLLGLFLESSARQSWFHARTMDVLSKFHAEDVMSHDTPTVEADAPLRSLLGLAGRRFIFFVAEADEHVVGVLTEKEVDEQRAAAAASILTAGEVARSTNDVATATLQETGESMLMRMEAASVWHMPVVTEGRVVGVVSKENLLRLLARGLLPEPRPAT